SEALAALTDGRARWTARSQGSGSVSVVNPLAMRRRVRVDLSVPSALERSRNVSAVSADEILAAQVIERDGPDRHPFASVVLDVDGFASREMRDRKSTRLN